MFTGIIETLGIVVAIDEDQSNRTFTIRSSLSSELKVDESVAHNGVCLTVVGFSDQGDFKVTAIKETLAVTTLGSLNIGDEVNIERSVQVGSRLDGHMVQGHVDKIAQCINITDEGGSWYFEFSIPQGSAHYFVHKGSIAIDGVSLTVISPTEHSFRVAIIPYTYEHTRFKNLKVGAKVNLEFDLFSKYFARYKELFRTSVL